MERKFLEDLGLSKEVIDKVMNAHSADVGKHKKTAESAQAAQSSLKTQFDVVSEKLKAFEGVDVTELKSQIAKLSGDLDTAQNAHAAELAERDFAAALNEAIAAAKGKNAKAIIGTLGNLDTLKASKNQKEDIAAALTALRGSDAYLFDDSKATSIPTTPAKVSTSGVHDENGGGSSSSTNQTMNALFRGGESKGD